jgi:hypothetical protein
MEEIMLFVKFILFFGLEFSVLIVIAAILVAGLYQVVTDKVQESRRLDAITSEGGPGAADERAIPNRS